MPKKHESWQMNMALMTAPVSALQPVVCSDDVRERSYIRFGFRQPRISPCLVVIEHYKARALLFLLALPKSHFRLIRTF
jgi:hypothetical protein